MRGGPAERARLRPVWALIIGLAIALATSCSGGNDTSEAHHPAPPLDEVRSYPVPSNKHVTGSVSYAQMPPVGGDHNADVVRCGFYTSRVVTEKAVHSMEHGAVWITYRPKLPAQDLDVLRGLTQQEHYLVVSPWTEDLPAPIVASAWGRQVMVASASDPALGAFIKQFVKGSQAPEPGAFC